ncbi:MAG: 30S ribosomal protein S12 methylthiotransferase RimO [Ardenticatenaceae bacterium]|nr:30S ribosomal protein S12 methylthiotransferase RimO [Anaerolineales bacterium]MCB8922803.1 30S ribosomal protein S12 methylthiotransferase RimO [Ardenticatenaceae bacterium]MCB8991936.1 30S ribosomal protein S12 methylthiotransferase RimO [Ardenticatenaceae bacterium]MCB9004746.1 30S ribosomal protein S12 methylthiotransferase RimO [Ardenticatenaceae bacterium]
MSKHKQKKQFFMLSLGCSKNTVDSESMARLLMNAGFDGTADPDDASVLIVNTCGFIEEARQESIGALRELAELKGKNQLLIAAGCMAQRYGAEVVEWVPGVDGVIGTRRWMDIVPFVRQLRRNKHPEPLYHLPESATTVGLDEKGVLRTAVQGRSAYLKISDGCRRPCAFCAIPQIKGTHVSRPLEAIVAEALALQEAGIQELILIAQDTTDYGHDLGLKNGLSQLLRMITQAAPDIPWIRLMYAYPGYVTDELIETMATSPQILPYVDIPLQHGSRETLKRMRRPANIEWVYGTVEKLRKAMPQLAIRTTFIVGYPGETDAEFAELKQFVRDLAFDRVGAFTYSYEASTPSATVAAQVPEEVKEARRDELMALQQPISLAKNQALVGRTLDVLVEGHGDGISVGRSYRDAPEIDGLVIVPGELPLGEIVPIHIDGAMAYDLTGSPVFSKQSPATSYQLPVTNRQS